MPPVIIAAAIAAAAGLTETGVAAYQSNNSSIDQANAQKNQQQATLQAQQAQANQANLSKQEAVLGAQGQTQAQTGGSLTDPGTTSLTDLLAGYPGYQGGTSTTSGSGTSTGTGIGSSGVSGGASPGGAGGNSGGPDIAAILATLQNSGGGGGLGSSSPTNLSGGNWQSPPTPPQGQFELASSVLG